MNIDFMAACDSLIHESLYKIIRYEINDLLHDWIRSLFSNRSQCVMINGC